MEIVLKRIAKQNTYTIGRMYILKDEEVERKVNYTLNKDQKRSFCHVVAEGVKEFQIIAQELTYYGVDIDGKHHITELISSWFGWRSLYFRSDC